MDICTAARVCGQNLQLRLPGDSARTPSVTLSHLMSNLQLASLPCRASHTGGSTSSCCEQVHHMCRSSVSAGMWKISVANLPDSLRRCVQRIVSLPVSSEFACSVHVDVQLINLFADNAASSWHNTSNMFRVSSLLRYLGSS
jgi:hypothetical protein